MKNKILLKVALFTLLLAFMTGCGSKESAGTNTSTKQQTKSSVQTESTQAQNESTKPIQEKVAIKTGTNKKSSQQLNENDMAKLMTIKPDDFQNYSVADFNNHIETNLFNSDDADAYVEIYEKLQGSVSIEDENHDFLLAIELTMSELYSKSFGEPSVNIYNSFMQYGNPIDNSADDEPIYDFLFLVSSNVCYSIEDETNITVGERNSLYHDLIEKLQSRIDSLSNEDMNAPGITESLQKEFSELSTSLNNDKIIFTIEIEGTEYLVN